jgi:hypothetical protein
VAAWREGRFDLVLPLAQLEEIGRVRAYPKIRRILQWDDEAIGRFLKQLYLRAEVVAPAAQEVALRDSGELHVLQALAAGAAERERSAIETPAQFVKRL